MTNQTKLEKMLWFAVDSGCGVRVELCTSVQLQKQKGRSRKGLKDGSLPRWMNGTRRYGFWSAILAEETKLS